MAKKPVLTETTSDTPTEFNIRTLNPTWPVSFEPGEPKTLKLAQAGTPEVQQGAANAGQYVIANTILPGFDELLVIPVAYQHTWTMMDADGETVLKRSVDDQRLYSADGSFIEANEGWTYRDDQWNDEDTKWHDKKQPKCKPGHTFLFYVVGMGMFVTFTFQSTNYQTGRRVYDAFRLFGAGRCFIVLSSQPANSKRYNYHVAIARFEMNVTEAMKDAREKVQALLDGPRLLAA